MNLSSRALSALTAFELACADPSKNIPVGDAVGADTLTEEDSDSDVTVHHETDVPDDTGSSEDTADIALVNLAVQNFDKLLTACMYGVNDSSAPLSLENGAPDSRWLAALHHGIADNEATLPAYVFPGAAMTDIVSGRTDLLIVETNGRDARGEQYFISTPPEGDVAETMTGLDFDGRPTISDIAPSHAVFECINFPNFGLGFMNARTYNDVALQNSDGLNVVRNADGTFRIGSYAPNPSEWDFTGTEQMMATLAAQVPVNALNFEALYEVASSNAGGMDAGMLTGSESGRWVLIPAQ